jgi:signal transduction histidine kinase
MAAPAGLLAAHELGKTAVADGLETLGLARIHEFALVELSLPAAPSPSRDDLINRAAVFFTEAITPIEETHCAAHQLNVALDERTRDLADSNRERQQQVVGRTHAEAALRDSEATFGQLLKDSRELEQHLQKVAHQTLAAIEAEQKKMSHQLNDEIAQTLLGINIRLLTLKQQIAISHENLNQEITATRNLIEQSLTLINRIAHEFNS